MSAYAALPQRRCAVVTNDPTTPHSIGQKERELLPRPRPPPAVGRGERLLRLVHVSQPYPTVVVPNPRILQPGVPRTGGHHQTLIIPPPSLLPREFGAVVEVLALRRRRQCNVWKQCLKTLSWRAVLRKLHQDINDSVPS